MLKIDSELRAFNPVPGGLQAIVAGLDEEAHIYMLDLDHQGVMQTWCYDALGFCSIGAGGGHSDAYMMSCRHHHSADLPTTLFSVYSAKRHAEVAPGVGKRTSCLIDSYVPGQGPFGKNLVDRLSTIYDAARESIRGITLTANQEVARYVEQEIAIIKKEEADKAQVDETGIRGHPKEGEPEDS